MTLVPEGYQDCLLASVCPTTGEEASCWDGAYKRTEAIRPCPSSRVSLKHMGSEWIQQPGRVAAQYLKLRSVGQALEESLT